MPALPEFVRRLFGRRAAVRSPTAPSPDAHVTPDASRCVQCGVCGYNCPVGIAVRDYARQGRVVDDARCVQCGQCIEVCPRGTLRWSSVAVFTRPDPAEWAEWARLFGPAPAEEP